LQLPGIEGAAKTTAASSFYRQIIIVVIVYIGIPVSDIPTKPVFWCFFGALLHLPILNLQLPGVETTVETGRLRRKLTADSS